MAPAVLRSAEHKRYVAGQMSCSHKKSKILLDFCVLNTYCKSMEKQRIFAGEITTVEKAEWLKQMKRDGFTALWTWICWVIRQHIKENHESSE